MKVLHLISGGDTGGAKTHVLSLLRELNSTEDVFLLCLGGGPLAQAAERMGLPCAVLAGGFLRAVRAAGRAAAEGGWQALHCHGSRANLTGALLKPRLSIPVITTIHSDHRLDYLGRPWARLIYGTLNSLALRRMDALVCVSDAMAETYRRRGFRGEKIYSIYNGPDFRDIPAPADRTAWLAARGVAASPGDVLLGAAARLDAVKDHGTMLRGFAAAVKQTPRLRLLLAGTGGEEARLRALAAALGVEGRVHFLGWVEDIDGFFSILDVNLLTSRSETFPYAVTAAARYGVPAVATAVGGIPALVEPGVTGLLIPPGDAPALAAALRELAEDPARRAALGAALRERTKTRFSLAAMGRRQREIYASLAAERRGVVISGACGRGNLGDEAMLEVILRQVREARPMAYITVASHRPRETAARFGVNSVHALRLAALWRACRGAGLFLSGGGNLLQDFTSRRSLGYYLLTLRMARRAGCRVALYGAGLGPLSAWGWRKSVKTLNRCAQAIVFREEQSMSAAREAGVSGPQMLCTADPALGVELPDDGLCRAAALESGRRYAVLCPRPWPGLEEKIRESAAAFVSFCRERGLTPVFLAMDRETDAPLARACAAAAGEDAVYVCPPGSAREAAAFFAGVELVVSMRLHALVLSSRVGTPCAGLDCDGRIGAFLAAVGQPWQRMEESGAALPALWDGAIRAAGETPSLRDRAEAERQKLPAGTAILQAEAARAE